MENTKEQRLKDLSLQLSIQSLDLDRRKKELTEIEELVNKKLLAVAEVDRLTKYQQETTNENYLTIMRLERTLRQETSYLFDIIKIYHLNSFWRRIKFILKGK